MIENENISIASQVIDIAEHKTYLELTSRVCFYNEPNLNKDMLIYDDDSEEKAQTLVSMPVQAKYKLNSKGEPTFGGHQMVKKKDGSVEFGTSSIGTHTSIYIEEDTVNINGVQKTLPCLFAKYRIWKRYKNVVAAVKRLFSLGKLFGSWEINTYKYIFENGIKKITDYEFLSNCLLGFEYSFPSYGENAVAINMAQANEQEQLMIAEALSQDLIDEQGENITKNKEDNMAKENIAEKVTNTVVENTTPVVPVEGTTTSTENKTEKLQTQDVAQLTSLDLRRRVSEACAKKIDVWCYVSYMFPNEKEVWCEYGNAETELDYVKFIYEVDANDVIAVSEPEYVKLTVSVKDVNTTISELNKSLEIVKAELDIKNSAIGTASENIQGLKVLISELEPYKTKVEAAEQKRIESEIAEQKKDLKEKLLKGNLFTDAEVVEKSIAELIEARDESAINKLIADKFVASFNVDIDTKKTETKTETLNVITATANLVSDEPNNEVDARAIMRKLIFN